MEKYSIYTNADAHKDGVCFAFSKYSTIVSDEKGYIGKFIFEEKPLRVNDEFISKCKDKDAVAFYNVVNNTPSLYLRKIDFREETIRTGQMEDALYYIASHIIPKDYMIWCVKDFTSTKKYIDNLLCFHELRYPIPQDGVLVFAYYI